MWIKCSERMPEPGVSVLVAFSGKVGIADRSLLWKGDYLFTGHGGSHVEVTHWMPFPDPPTA